MQNAYLRNKLNLYWRQIIIVVFLGISGFHSANGQSMVRVNLPNYDEQWLHYGFLIGIHGSSYKLDYSDSFVTPRMDSLHSIIPNTMPGFKLGFIANIHVLQYLDLRALVQVGFYEYQVEYNYTDNTTFTEFRDATMVEFPILLKYKSVRRGNIGMYMIGGINPAFEASAKGEDEENIDRLQTKNFNLALEVGFGFDLYFPLFKFSPELRYSYGIINGLEPERNPLSEGLSRLVPHNLGIFITFEGGPS